MPTPHVHAAMIKEWVDDTSPSPTEGMNIAQRILHVGGRNNEAGYVEFGSIQAVEALVMQVLRDMKLPTTLTIPVQDHRLRCKQQPLTDEQIRFAWDSAKGTTYGYAPFARAIEAAHGIKEAK